MTSINPDRKMDSVRSKMIDVVIDEILPWIDAHLSDESVRIKTVTERSGYGHWHFQRMFREQTGYNLATYIRLRRISRAAVSLAFTEKGIIEIAIENGFSSQQSFNRTFKKHFDISPNFFRKTCSGHEAMFNKLTRDRYRDYEFFF